MKEKVNAIIQALKERYPDALCALQYQKDYELMIAVRLSAQCTDARVNLVTPALFDAYPTLESLAQANVADIETYIHNIFARVIENEEILKAPPPDVCELSKDDNIIKMTNDLRFMMQDQDVAESDIIKSIQEIASERFNAYTSSDNTVVTELIKEKILESKAQSRIKAETIGEVVQRILLAPDRTVTVKLKNGIEFVERME